MAAGSALRAAIFGRGFFCAWAGAMAGASRLIYFPFTPMNFAMGLTGVRFRDYFPGTGLGILLGTFIFPFLVGTLKEVWASGDRGGLISPRVFFSLCLFIFSLFIPKRIKRFRKGEG